MEEQFENKERTVYLSSTGDFIKTDLTNPREIKYAAEIQLAKKDRDKFFGLKPLEQDRAEITKAAMEDKGRGYLKQAGAGIGSAIVNMGQTVWNWAKYTNANLVNKAWRKLNDYSADILKATGSINEETRASMMNQVNNNYKSVRDILNEEMLLSREKQNAYLEKTGLAKKEGDSLIYDIANGVGSVAAALGVAIVTKSPNAAAVLFGGIAGQSGYEEALAAGIEPEKALKVGSVRGLVEGTLEKIGLHCYIEGLKTRGIITRILKNAAVEATQEMSQQTAEEILQTKYGGRKEDWKRAAEDILLSGFVGMIVGGGFSAAGAGTNMIEQENAAQKDTSKISLPTQKLPTQNIDLTDAFESGVKRFTDLGMPEKDAAELTFSLLKKAAEPETAKEIVDMIREENSNLTYLNNDEDQNAAAVAEAIKQATAPDRVVKQQAFNIADEVEEGALKAGRTPEEAAASASLAQKASMGFYELTGVLPKDQIQIKIEADKEAELNAANENDLTGEEDISFDFGFAEEEQPEIKESTPQNLAMQEEVKNLQEETRQAQAQQLLLEGPKQAANTEEIKDTYINSILEEKQTAENEEQAEPENKDKIEDAGEFLLGNKKKNTNLVWEDFSQMNDLVKKANMTKQKIYKMPAFEDLKKEYNLSDRQAGFVMYVYSKINSKPSKSVRNTEENQKMYVEGVKKVMDSVIKYAQDNKNTIEGWQPATNSFMYTIKDYGFFDTLFPARGEQDKYYNRFSHNKDYNDLALVLGGNKFVRALQIRDPEVKEIDALTEKLKNPTQKTAGKKADYEKLFAVAKDYSGKYFVRGLKEKISYSADLSFDTKEAAEEYAKKLFEIVKPYLDNGGDIVSFAGLRKGIERRKPNENIDAQGLIDTFGFRGVNFGNWTKQSERQEFLNLTYDSLFDLAEILNVPPEALSFGGTLGLAYGAQGQRGAAAHFIPQYNEINLTRKNGMGSLAHEWFHALDYYFGNIAQGKDFSGKNILDERQAGGVRPEVFAAFENLRKAMTKKPATLEELEKAKENVIKNNKSRIEFYIEDLKQVFRNEKNLDKMVKIAQQIGEETDLSQEKFSKYATEYLQLIRESRRKSSDDITMTRHLHWIDSAARGIKRAREMTELLQDTEFLKEARALDKNNNHKKAYFTKNTEMGARAFTAYVLDKMEEKEQQNFFLTHKDRKEVDILAWLKEEQRAAGKNEKEPDMKDFMLNWSPVIPEERKAIIKAFDNLFETLKTKKTDKGITFYQSGKDTRVNKPVPAAKDTVIKPVLIEKGVPNFGSIKELKEYLFNDLKVLNDIEVKSVGTTLHFGEHEVRRGLKNARSKTQNQFFADLKKAVGNAQYARFEPADAAHPNVAGQDIYYTAIKIGNDIYAIRIKADVALQQKSNLYNYAGHKVIDIKKYQGIDTDLTVYNPDTISIAQFDEIFKTQKLNQDEENPRGSVTFADDIKQAFIKFNNTADKSTLIHELGHIWLKDIEQFSAISQKPEFLEFKENLDKWLGEPVNGVYSVEQQEKFAKTFERYLQEGKAPNAELKTIFEKFKAWLSEIYTAVKDFIQLSPEAVKTFDTLLSTERGKYNLENIRNKTAQAKAVVEKIKKGQAVSIDGITIKDIKEALKVMNSRMPAEPKENLLRVLRRKGANYANAGKIDKEAYKNAYVPNKKDGIQDGLALTLRDWGFMAFDDSAVADYEGLSKQEEIAADLIDRALNGEKIYQVNDPQAAKREQFLADVEKAREIVGENGEEIARAIAALEEKGYRIIEKEDINYLARQLKELDRIVEKSQILESQEEKEKGNKEFEKMKKQTALEARRIKAAVIEELNKRDIAGKSTMFAVLEKAQTPEEIFTAAADILTEISREFEKTEEGQAEQRKIDVPKTDWEAKRVNLLKELAEISANATKEERAARNMIEQARQARHGARAALSKKELAEYEKAKSFLSKSFEKKYLKAFNNALRGEPHIEGKDVASIMRVMANNAMEMRLISDHIVKQFISIAQRKQTANYKKYLSGKISALLNNKIFAKVGQLRRAKFTPEIMEFMKHAKEIWGLTNKDAEKEYDFRAKSYDPENPPSPVQAFENRLLEFKVLWDTQDPADAKGLYDELLDLLRGDRQLKRFEEAKKQFNESGRRLILTQALKEKKLPVGTKAYLLHAGTDLQSALDVLFGKFEYETMGYDGKMHKEIFNAREEFAGELDQIEEQNFLHHYNMALDESVRSAYGLDTKFQMFDKIKELLDYKKEVINYGFIKDTENGAMIASIFRNGKWVDNNNPRKQTLNKLNIIYDYIQSQNHEYVETAEGIKDVGYAARLERSYGKEQLNDMFACLTDQDRKLADSLIELASKFYPELNKVHKRIYGFALPKTEGVYFPGVTERIADDVDWHADFVANSKSPSFIKERVKSNKPVMALVNPLAVLKAHGRRSAEFIYNAERFTELKRMFKAEEMKTAFVEKFGQNDGIELYQKMLRLIDLQGPQKAQTKGEFFKVSDKIFNNWVKTAMGLKIMTGIKQVASGISFAEKMPAATYTKYFAEAMAHPVQTMDFMNKTFPYIETRFETGGINEAVARAMARNDISAMGEKFSMITNLGLLNTRYGDKLSISLFGQPYYRYLREDLKLPEDKAKAEFLRQATTTLQSSLKSQLSEAQSVADNFATRVFMVFRNQQLQYVRKAFTTYAQYKNGELSAKQFAKAEFIYLVLNPLVYVALGIGFIPRDDDDKKRLAAAPITQTLGAYPFGEATAELFVDNVYSMFKDKELTAPQKMGLPMIDDIVKDITRAVKTVNEDDLTAEDYMDATLGIAKYSGLPLNTLKSMIKGGVDITKGKPAKGALEVIGYTETRAGKIVGEEKKKKKKRKRRKK